MHGRQHSERGMVTAEIAVGLTGVVIALIAAVWVINVVATQIRCVDAARDVARALARGETPENAVAEGRRSAPREARIVTAERDGWAEVEVSVEARPPWRVLATLPPIRIEGRAAVALEPDSGLPATTRATEEVGTSPGTRTSDEEGRGGR